MWAGAAAAQAPVILVLGDSLGAAYGLPQDRGWVSLLQRRLREQGYPHTVVNASASGETSAGGLARLPALLERHHPDILLLELGANDGLRGLPVVQLRANLERMLALARAARARPVLFEMRLPPNYGAAYGQAFHQTFRQVAQAQQLPLVPFFLGAIALNPAEFQDDGLHPGAAAQPKLLEAVWPTLEPLLRASAQAAHPGSAPRRKAAGKDLVLYRTP